MILAAIISIVIYIILKTVRNRKSKRIKVEKRIRKEKELIINFVTNDLYHNQLEGLQYIRYKNNKHILQIQYRAKYYKIEVKNHIEKDKFTYRVFEIPAQQMYHINLYDLNTHPQ